MPQLTKKAISFINESAPSDNPFFLYFPLPAPHTPILPSNQFVGKSGTNAYGDFVLMVDDVVGQVMDALKDNGIEDNTLIIFTSDNGCSPMANFKELDELGHNPSHVFRGHKADIFDGGHRIPFIVRWPEKINHSQQSDETICLVDFMATCASIVDYEIADNSAEDSYNIMPALMGKLTNNSIREATVHHSEHGDFSIRRDKWKLNFCPGSGGWSFPTPNMARNMDIPPIQLYDMENDPKESNNLAVGDPNREREIIDRLTERLKGKLDRDDISAIFGPVYHISKKLQKK